MTYGVSSKRSLHVALISEGARPTPLHVRGGTALIAELSRELGRLGHHTTVLAAPEPARQERGAVLTPGAQTYDQLAELRRTGAAWAEIRRLEGVDLVHVSSPEAIPFSAFLPVPTVATVHHDRRAPLSTHYRAYPAVSFVAISRRQTELAADVPFRAVVHPGLHLERYPLGRGGRRCVFVGSLTPEHGAHVAIEAARRARSQLVLAGESPRARQAYFAEHIVSELGAGVSWIGEVHQRRRIELLSGARALLAPIHWEDPFGLVMIEAMLVGTPVIAYACGAVPEIVEDGVTGFVVHDLDEMCRRIRDVGRIDRRACRARARARWSAVRMAREYAALYQEVIEHYWSAKHSVGGAHETPERLQGTRVPAVRASVSSVGDYVDQPPPPASCARAISDEGTRREA